MKRTKLDFIHLFEEGHKIQQLAYQVYYQALSALPKSVL